MFGAGVQAPPSVGEPVSRQLERVSVALRTRIDSVDQWVSGEAPTTVESSVRTEYHQLLLASRPKAPGAYGVQVGVYSERQVAQRHQNKLKTQGHTSQLIAIGPNAIADSFVLAMGPFGSLREARHASLRLGFSSLGDAPRVVIRFPQVIATNKPAAKSKVGRP